MNLDKVATHPLQTKAWKDFREAWGNEILETKYGIITLHKIPFLGKKIGMFIRGPKPDKSMLAGLKKIGKENNLIFIKLEPNTPKNEKLVSLMKENGAVKGKTLFTPTSFQIDLSRSEDELLASFKPKTRYNIRYAQKHGVEVREDNSQKAFNAYMGLMRETVMRQRFYAHSQHYHKLMWHYLSKANVANLLVARKGRDVLTTWIVFKWRDTLYYPYGASSSKNQNLQPNALMMWEAIRFGKKNKLKKFDLWGREEGKGFTRFKEGFNPELIEFLGTWDLVINKNYYYLYLLLEKLRWLSLRAKSRFTSPRF